MNLTFFAVKTTGNAAWRQPLEEQPYIYEIARQQCVFDTQQWVFQQHNLIQSFFVRPKAELHPRVQTILKINRDSLDDEPDFSEIAEVVQWALESAQWLVSHDRMQVQWHLENERIRMGKSLTLSSDTLSFRILTKERADMRTKKNKRLRAPTLKELHTKLFSAKRIELYTAMGVVEAQVEILQWLIQKRIIERDSHQNIFKTPYRASWIYYRAR